MGSSDQLFDGWDIDCSVFVVELEQYLFRVVERRFGRRVRVRRPRGGQFGDFGFHTARNASFNLVRAFNTLTRSIPAVPPAQSIRFSNVRACAIVSSTLIVGACFIFRCGVKRGARRRHQLILCFQCW